MMIREYWSGECGSSLVAPGPMLSPSRITHKNNGRIWRRLEQENGFAKMTGGGNDAAVEPALPRNILF